MENAYKELGDNSLFSPISLATPSIANTSPQAQATRANWLLLGGVLIAFILVGHHSK